MQSSYQPTAAEHLASLVTGNAESAYIGAAVQRSHRFPLQLFIQIENLAQMGGIPISMVINELIEAGLEAVRQKLPEEVLTKIGIATNEQLQRKTVTDSVTSTKRPAVKSRQAKK